MIVYHLSRKELVGKLRKKKMLTVDKTKIERDYVRCYRRMVEQMHLRMYCQTKSDNYPWWAWYIGSRDELGNVRYKPDLSSEYFLNKGTDAVMLTLDIPDEEILLSNFLVWSLNMGRMDSDCDKHLLSVWKHVFDIDKEKAFQQNLLVQATFWFLRWSDVINVEYFSAA